MGKERLLHGWSPDLMLKYYEATGKSLDTFAMNGLIKKHRQLVEDAIRTKTPIKYKYNKDEIL